MTYDLCLSIWNVFLKGASVSRVGARAAPVRRHDAPSFHRPVAADRPSPLMSKRHPDLLLDPDTAPDPDLLPPSFRTSRSCRYYRYCPRDLRPSPSSFLLSRLVCTPSVGRMAVLLGRPSHRRITIRRHRHQQNGHAPAGLSTHGECGILNQILKKGREVFRDTTVGGGIHDGGTHHGMRRVRRGNAAAG